MDECISYQSHIFELFVPSPIVLLTFCISYDKTELFIVSLIRLIIYIIIYYMLEDMMNLESHRIIKYLLLISIWVNILYIGIVVSKNPLYSMGSEQSIAQDAYDRSDKVSTIPLYPTS